MNFFLAYAVASFESTNHNSGHTVFCNDFSNNYGRSFTPRDVYTRGVQLEKYVNIASLKEAPMYNDRSSAGFNLQRTIKNIAVKVPSKIVGYDNFRNTSP